MARSALRGRVWMSGRQAVAAAARAIAIHCGWNFLVVNDNRRLPRHRRGVMAGVAIVRGCDVPHRLRVARRAQTQHFQVIHFDDWIERDC